MNDKNIEVWLRIFEAICTLHSSGNGQGTLNAEKMANEVYERLMVKYKHEQNYGSSSNLTTTYTYVEPEEKS